MVAVIIDLRGKLPRLFDCRTKDLIISTSAKKQPEKMLVTLSNPD